MVNDEVPVQPEDVTVLVIVYVPAVLLDAVTAPVLVLIVRPAGVLLNVPPAAPVMVGFIKLE